MLKCLLLKFLSQRRITLFFTKCNLNLLHETNKNTCKPVNSLLVQTLQLSRVKEDVMLNREIHK